MRKVLFFHAPWCSPCRFYEKQFIHPLEKLVGREKIQYINAQEHPFTAEKYMVDKLPTVILLGEETVYKHYTGSVDLEETAIWLEGK